MRHDRKTKEPVVKTLINEKMRVLDDFNICERNDKKMKERLARVIAENPGKDPREVLDYYCRPMIQMMVNQWN